jgi:hypothetical protein
MIKIDKGIPVSRRHGSKNAGRKCLYPWAEMVVGDSFFVPKTSKTMNGSVAAAARRLGFRFVARTVEEEGVQGCRVWRVS